MNVYMDESGSVHPVAVNLNRFFIISIIIPKNNQQLKKVCKLFVRKNFQKLKNLDSKNKMFNKKGKFLEFKGACFDRKMKNDFMDFFCQKNLFRVGYIILDNNRLQQKFISNKARTFNYLLKLFFANAVQRKYIEDEEIFLHIDERNVRTGSRFSLEDYLNQELILNLGLIKNVKTKYYDSSQNQLIQVADVFSNIMYSNLMTHGDYEKKLKRLQSEGYILPLFRFPK